MRSSTERIAFPLAAALALSALPARAMPPAAESAYEAGKSALKAGDAATALARFREAMVHASPPPPAATDERDVWQLLLAIALAHEKLDAPGHAIETYRRFLARTEKHASILDAKWRERRKVAEESVATLERSAMERHGYVAVVTEPEGAALLVDGRRAGADGDAVTPFGVYLRPGEARVRVEMPGREPAEAVVRVEAGKLHPLSLVLTPAKVEPAAATSSGDPARSPGAAPARPFESTTVTTTVVPSAVKRYGPWVLIASGVTTAGSGVRFTLEAADAKAELDRLSTKTDPYPTKSEWEDARDRLDRSQAISWALYGTGAALAAGGVLWLVLAQDDPTEPSVGVHVAPAHGGVALGLAGRF